MRKEEKIRLAKEVYNRATAGEDFAALALSYSDQAVTEEDAKNGYTFEKGGFVSNAAETAVFEMKVGEIRMVETEGGIYILLRKGLEEKLDDGTTAEIRSHLEDVKKYALVSEVEDKYSLNTSFLNELDIASIAHVV